MINYLLQGLDLSGRLIRCVWWWRMMVWWLFLLCGTIGVEYIERSGATHSESINLPQSIIRLKGMVSSSLRRCIRSISFFSQKKDDDVDVDEDGGRVTTVILLYSRSLDPIYLFKQQTRRVGKAKGLKQERKREVLSHFESKTSAHRSSFPDQLLPNRTKRFSGVVLPFQIRDQREGGEKNSGLPSCVSKLIFHWLCFCRCFVPFLPDWLPPSYLLQHRHSPGKGT